ncbi:L,D-transpeptidase family protein [Garciella nitratireducens]|uniref:Putative peptidoglycan binding domain-containing protein n=1 Tax=Garciella nitratireducens DSM 15102 TaxID=1121911 RepID=A0A1T4LHA3_9FIRM|nr:peptidoglycan-binding protein [Garciella nitratireducens]SJZ54083.1 Putative peptidoglycan binding domain-containing protein [Garciella nitratireducens DSM 15102]
MTYASRYLRIMTPYMEGIDVQSIQQRLRELGYYEGETNGVYDSKTSEAVISYQKAAGLLVDGVVGPDTWNAIGISPKYLEYFDSVYFIEIDLEQKSLALKERGTIISTYSVAVGKPETPTPTGFWKIIEKTLNPGGPFGARWMRMSIPWGGYGIHGTDQPESIGTAASHGCVRMYNEDVIKLYEIVPLGTAVEIIGETFTGRLLYVGVDGGSDVLRVQRILQEIDYYQGPLDGIYSQELKKAIIAFQRDYGLIADGVVGTNTYKALEKVYDRITENREP